MVELVIVRIIYDNGVIGWGEVFLMIVIIGDSMDSIESVIYNVLKLVLFGKSLFGCEVILYDI